MKHTCYSTYPSRGLTQFAHYFLSWIILNYFWSILVVMDWWPKWIVIKTNNKFTWKKFLSKLIVKNRLLVGWLVGWLVLWYVNPCWVILGQNHFNNSNERWFHTLQSSRTGTSSPNSVLLFCWDGRRIQSVYCTLHQKGIIIKHISYKKYR